MRCGHPSPRGLIRSGRQVGRCGQWRNRPPAGSILLLVLIGMFGLGMAGLLMLNTTPQSQAFQSRTLNRQGSRTRYAQADLENQLDALAAPQELARRASALGMRPNPFPAFLVPPSGKVVGKPRPVSGREVPALIVKTPAQLAAERGQACPRRSEGCGEGREGRGRATVAAQGQAKALRTSRTAAKQKKATLAAGTTTKEGRTAGDSRDG